MAEHSDEFLQLVNAARENIAEIDASQLAQRLKADPKAALIDVREESEYAAGHVQGAEHIGKGVIERDIVARHPDKAQPLYLYCGGGYRSALAADALRRMGYTRVINVDGGWRALREIMHLQSSKEE